MALRDPNKVLEIRIRDGKAVPYTAQQFYDEVMRDKTKLAVNKFFHVTDDWQSDQMQDADRPRRGKRYSISRDTMEGPGKAGGHGGFPAFGPQVFRDEADRLIARGCVKRQVDWHNDESITSFFRDVQMALANANAAQVQDIVSAGPSIFLFTELMKRTEVIVEEQLTEMWARRLFPIRMLKTWMPTWNYIRQAEQSPHLPQYVNLNEVSSNIGRHRERRVPVVRHLQFWDDGADWTQHELWQLAEAVSNGAANYQLDMKRIASAQRNLLYKENLIAFFGDTEAKLLGLLSPSADTGIEHIPAPAQFGDGSAELDRQLLVNTALQIADTTDTLLMPNAIMLSNRAYWHVIGRRYGSVDNPSDQVVDEAALSTLSRIGISTITRVPELGPREAEAKKLLSKGVNATEAARLSGGVYDADAAAQVDVMVFMRRDPAVAELIVAQDITPYPSTETMRGKTEMRWCMGGGGMEFYQPEGIKIMTNVSGPNTAPNISAELIP